MSKFIFIFSFMYNPERKVLFDFCIDRLQGQIKEHKLDAKILIHELGKDKELTNSFINRYSDYYSFSYSDDIFNRAWSFNKVIRNIRLEEDTTLILMDTDLIVKNDWISNLNKYKIDKFMVGWSGVWYLNKKYTKYVMNDEADIETFKKTDWKEIGSYHVPNIDGSAGRYYICF